MEQRDDNMRILICTNSLSDDGYSGGVDTIVRRQHEAIQAKGHNSRVLAAWVGTANHNLSNDFILFETKRNRFLPRSLVFKRKLYIAMWKEVHAAEIVVIHSCEDSVTSFCALISIIHRKPFVVQTHGMLRTKVGIRRIFQRYYAALLSQAKMVLTLSDKEKADLRTYGVKSITQMIGNIAPAPRKGLVRNPNLVSFVGRFSFEKAPDVFMRVVSSVKKDFPSLEVRMIGIDQGMKALIEVEINKNGYQSWCRIIPESDPESAIKLICESQVVMVPSRFDTFPSVILEAAVNSTCLIVSSNVEISRELQDLEVALVGQSEDELRENLLELLNSPVLQLKLQKNAFDWIQRNYSLEVVSNQLDEYLRMVKR
jgi:glycosyltransferase involved in cell wall biosynthesis